MAIHGTGSPPGQKPTVPIWMSEIATEFGGATPHWLSEYYSAGAYVPAGTTGVDGVIPSAGSINMHQFYETTAAVNVDWILVGGGGGGGAGVADIVGGGGGGGGGGGVSYGVWSGGISSFNVNVTIGAGAAAVGYNAYGLTGTGSSIVGALSATTTGGEGGSAPNGNGGAAGWSNAYGGAGGAPNGSPRANSYAYGNSNGIGAGSGGGAADDTWARPGGNGYRWPINATHYGGGGGGGADNSAAGGLGGGGSSNGPGVVNTGGGGAGGQEGVAGGAGGSGVALFSYVSPTQLLSGGIVTSTGSGATTRWFHRITTSGGVVSLSASTVPYIFTATIATNTTNYNIFNIAAAAGWNMVAPLIATVTINPGVTVSSSSSSVSAFNTGALSVGSTVNITNNGSIIGAGGLGGVGGTGYGSSGAAGASGGIAVRTTVSTTITNNGTIAGGGGGGGGGAGYNVITGYSDENGMWPIEAAAQGAGGSNGVAGTGTPGVAGLAQYGAGGGAGGAAGPAVSGNSGVTWITTGTRVGPLV